MKEWLGIYLRGLMVGTADVVPGISGGTIAIVLGIYTRLIHALRHPIKECGFLLPLVCGMVTAILALSHFVEMLLHHEVYRIWLYSLFFGLIASSILFLVRRIGAWGIWHAALLFIGAIAAFQLTVAVAAPDESAVTYDLFVGDHELYGVSAPTLAAMAARGIIDGDTPLFSGGYTYAAEEVLSANVAVEPSFLTRLGLDPWLMMSGLFAILAMLMPGISGSYVLVILGAYPIVIGAIADLTRGQWDALLPLGSLAIGIAVGAMLFSRAISWLLAWRPGETMSLLVGFMVGAMPAVWPFWHVEAVCNPLDPAGAMQLKAISPVYPDIDSPIFLVALLLGLSGFLSIIVADRLATRTESTAT